MADLYGVLLSATMRGETPELPRPFNADHLLWRAGEHGLHGLLRSAVDARGASLPEPLRNLAPRLRALAAGQEAVVRSQLAVAGEAARALDRRGVAAVFVKGAALASDVYENPGQRPFSDLDLLVTADSTVPAREALEAIGFRVDLTIEPSPMEIRLIRAGAPGLGAAIDLHWDFTASDAAQAAVRIPVAEVLGRRREAGGLPVPSVEDSLLLAAANLVRSRLDRLMLLADFDRLLRRAPDVPLLLSRAEKWKLRTALWLGFEYARRVLGTPVPPELLETLRPPAWRTAWIHRMLGGRTLWHRRKFKRWILSALLPYLCLDSWEDVKTGVRAWRTRFPGARR